MAMLVAILIVILTPVSCWLLINLWRLIQVQVARISIQWSWESRRTKSTRLTIHSWRVVTLILFFSFLFPVFFMNQLVLFKHFLSLLYNLHFVCLTTAASSNGIDAGITGNRFRPDWSFYSNKPPLLWRSGKRSLPYSSFGPQLSRSKGQMST